MRVMRVNAHSDSRLRPYRPESLRLRGFAAVPGFEDDHHALEARGLTAFDNVFQVSSKNVVGKMAMRVDHRSRICGIPRVSSRAFLGVVLLCLVGLCGCESPAEPTSPPAKQ